MTSGRLLVCLAVLVLAFTQARATPLDADTCAKLTAEHAQLETAGVEANLEKGPDWARSSLSPEQIQQIRRYIELEEQLLFRCRDKSLVKLAPEADPGSTTEPNGNDKDAAAPKAAAPPPGAAKKTKGPAATTKTVPAKKAAVQPASKAPGSAKQNPADAKTPAKAAAKKPGDPGAAPAAKPKVEDPAGKTSK